MRKVKKTKTLELTLTAMGAVIIALCSWLSIPAMVPFTLQTFAVFFVLCMLGGKNGTLSIFVYILLGAVGVPVFHGFTGGIGILFGATGGYIVGFLLTGIVYMTVINLFGSKLFVRTAALILGLLFCYAVGTIWFVIIYTKNNGATTFAAALKMCVIPFVLPDLLKLGAALLISERLKKHISFI